jgi:hypothetical protein
MIGQRLDGLGGQSGAVDGGQPIIFRQGVGWPVFQQHLELLCLPRMQGYYCRNRILTGLVAEDKASGPVNRP